MFSRVGRNLPLSASRRFIVDLLHAARKVPLAIMERRMDVAPLVAARQTGQGRIGWCTLFTKAFALLAARHADLRRAYLGFPRPHLYEHPSNVAAVAVERRFAGEKCVFFGHVPIPEALSLPALEAALKYFKEYPVPGVDTFRRALHVSRLPRPLRRLIWWAGLNVSGAVRANYIGTFGVTATAALGASALYGPSPLTTVLHYGPLDAHGSLDVRLGFDHRVLDGAPVARLLKELERTLHGPILAELRTLGNEPGPASAACA